MTNEELRAAAIASGEDPELVDVALSFSPEAQRILAALIEANFLPSFEFVDALNEIAAVVRKLLSA